MPYGKIIGEIVQAKKEHGGLQQVFFTACGGSYAAQYPAKYFLDCESKKLKRIALISANEFVHATPASLGADSLVIAVSYQGTTPETVEAARVAREKGATTITLSQKPESPLCQNGDYVITYAEGERDKLLISDESSYKALCLAMEILQQTEGFSGYDAMKKDFADVVDICKKAKEDAAKSAADFAEAYKNEKQAYTMASGPAWAAAYTENICIFMEMQWLHSSWIHSGEYFHGPFEITDKNLLFLMLKSIGKTRPLDERAEKFLGAYARKVETIDAAAYGADKLSSAAGEYFSGLILDEVLNVYNKQLAEARRHPLKTRRYMWKVQY